MNQVRDQSARNILVHFISFFVNFSEDKKSCFQSFSICNHFETTLDTLSRGIIAIMISIASFYPLESVSGVTSKSLQVMRSWGVFCDMSREDTGALREEVRSNHFAVTSAVTEALHMVPVCRCYH
jgi:hypothetical protein